MPNEIQWLAAMFLDPARTADYLSSNCVTETIQKPRSWEYGFWIPNDEYDQYLRDEDARMVQCVDNFGAWDDFERYCRCCASSGASTLSLPIAVHACRACQYLVLCVANVRRVCLAVSWDVFRYSTEHSDAASTRGGVLQHMIYIHHALPTIYSLSLSWSMPAVVLFTVFMFVTLPTAQCGGCLHRSRSFWSSKQNFLSVARSWAKRYLLNASRTTHLWAVLSRRR